SRPLLLEQSKPFLRMLARFLASVAWRNFIRDHLSRWVDRGGRSPCRGPVLQLVGLDQRRDPIRMFAMGPAGMALAITGLAVPVDVDVVGDLLRVQAHF